MLIKRKSIEQAESSRRPARKPKFAPVTLSEQDGVRYLHFGTEWVQGAMRIRKPDWPELEYAQQMMAWMLFIEAPRTIAQLGLGEARLDLFLADDAIRQHPGKDRLQVELAQAGRRVGGGVHGRRRAQCAARMPLTQDLAGRLVAAWT